MSQNLASAQTPAQPGDATPAQPWRGLLRTAASTSTTRLRHRRHRAPQGQAQPPDPGRRAVRPGQPGAPRRHRPGAQHRRRRRRALPDPAPLLPQGGAEGGPAPARRGRLRRGHALLPARRPPGRRRRAPRLRGGLRRGRRAPHVLARGARGPARPGQHGPGLHAHHPAGLPAPPGVHAARPGLRAQALCLPPHHRAHGRRQPRACRQDLLRVLHVQSHHRLQGHARGHADAPLLHRPQRRCGGDLAGPGALPLLHQHHAQLGARSPQPLYHPQRRD